MLYVEPIWKADFSASFPLWKRATTEDEKPENRGSAPSSS